MHPGDAPADVGSCCVMLDLKLLTTFREVAVRRSFSDAAAALDFTQPAVSQHIGRLERTVGVRLLERDARAVSLTPAGEVLLRHASALLETSRRAEEAVRAAAGIGRSVVRVGAFPSAAAGLLPGATRELRARRPDAELDLHVLEEGPALDALLAGRIEVATIVVSPLSPSSPRSGVEYLHVCDDELRVAVSADHPLATRTSLALEELRDEPFLLTEVAGTCADSNVVLHAFRAAGYEPAVRFSSDDYQALQGMAASGIGVALIPTMALMSSRRDVVVLPLRGSAPSRRVLAAVRAGERDPLADHLIEALRAAGRGLGAAPTLTAAA
jgi:DNA-binding transcriptional LysR family regulator